MLGSRVGPYRVTAELGSGGMGRVYRAEGPEGVVALKVVHEQVAATPGFLERFLREGEIGKRVRHENVVRALAAGETDGRHWLALEYVEGQTLHSLQRELGTVPEELCRHVAHEVAAGLAAIHAAGIVHRDLKPENVLITRDHVVKVMDLGVARGAEDDSRLTQTGAFVGSLQYAAPEQFSGGGRRPDGRSDLHALGVLLYELTTGTNPFEDADWRVVFHRVLKETPRRLGAVHPQVSPFFEELVDRLLRKDPGERFQSADEVREALELGERSAWWRDRAQAVVAQTRRPLRRVRVPHETAIHGREREVAALLAAFGRASSGEGRVVLVEGEAGVGKSRLLEELAARLQERGEECHLLTGSYPPGGAATASGAFSTAFREHFAGDDAALRAVLPETPLLVPAFAALLRSDVVPADAQALTKDSLQTCFVRATQALARERVTIVVIDDLHFAPEEGRALFASLALGVAGHRVLLVGTARPGVPEAWIAQISRLPHAARLPLARLGPDDLVRLLADAVRSAPLAEELSARIAPRSDGNPFFALEILRSLKEGRQLERLPDGSWTTTSRIDRIEIPPSVADLVTARIADLLEEDRNLLEVASCVGFEFDARLVADVLGTGYLPVLRRLARIEKGSLLVRSAGNRFVFDHHQVQEALAGGMPQALRQELHAAIAEALEARHGGAAADAASLGGALAVELAEHFLEGGRGERALRWLGAALDHLERAYRNEAEVRLAGRALAAPGLLDGRERFEVLLRLAARFDLLGRREEEQAALEEALALARARDDRPLEARATARLGGALRKQVRFDEARARYDRVVTMARELGDRRTEGEATGSLGVMLQAEGRVAEAKEHFERALAIAREVGDGEGEASATGGIANCLEYLGRIEEALAFDRHYLDLARRNGNRLAEATATGNVGVVLQALGRHEEAFRQCERHLALARELGDRLGETRATGNLGSVAQSLGRLADARAYDVRYLALAREVGYRRGEAIATANLGSVLLDLGCLGEGRAHLERQIEIVREIRDRRGEGFGLHLLGTVARAAGDAAGEERLLDEALVVRREIGHEDGVAETLCARGALRAECGRDDDAREDLLEASRLAASLRLPDVSVLAAAHLVLLDRADAGPALAALALHGSRLSAGTALQARLLLWRATCDATHLGEAARLLDSLVEHAPPECRESMLENVRLHREVAAACGERGLA